MTALTWDSDPVSDGLERVVLFPPASAGVPWNGLTSVAQAELGSSTTLYFDGRPYLVYTEEGPFACSIEAFTYPDAFETLNSFPHMPFGLSWRETFNEGYQIHVAWGATAQPSAKKHTTRDPAVELTTFSWDISTIDLPIEGAYRASHLMVSSETAPPLALAALEDLLYGTEVTESYLPSPQVILEIFRAYPHVKITDNGDGTWTAEADEESHIQFLGNGVVTIESGGIEFIDEDTFTITTW